MGPIDEPAPRSHYHFRISLHVRHPSMAPEKITEALGIEPKHSWKAGEAPQTPKGTPLNGYRRATYWTVDVAAGRWPLDINEAIHDALKRLARYSSLLHQIRAEGGTVELFVAGFSRTKAAP